MSNPKCPENEAVLRERVALCWYNIDQARHNTAVLAKRAGKGEISIEEADRRVDTQNMKKDLATQLRELADELDPQEDDHEVQP